MLRQAGMTLIELMIALGIFAVIGVLSYRALDRAAVSEARIALEATRWRQIGRAFQFMEGDFSQIVPVVAPLPGAAVTPALRLVRNDQGSELQLLVLDGGDVRRVGYRFAANGLEGLRWKGREAAAPSERETLLADVRDVRWRFLRQGQWLETWPADDATALPDAVEATVETADAGAVVKLYALR